MTNLPAYLQQRCQIVVRMSVLEKEQQLFSMMECFGWDLVNTKLVKDILKIGNSCWMWKAGMLILAG